MDKQIESFMYSIMAFLGIGIGLISLIIFFIKGISGLINLGIPIAMIIFGLYGVVNLFSDKS